MHVFFFLIGEKILKVRQLFVDLCLTFVIFKTVMRSQKQKLCMFRNYFFRKQQIDLLNEAELAFLYFRHHIKGRENQMIKMTRDGAFVCMDIYIYCELQKYNFDDFLRLRSGSLVCDIS